MELFLWAAQLSYSLTFFFFSRELEFPLCLPSQSHLVPCQGLHLVDEEMGPTNNLKVT